MKPIRRSCFQLSLRVAFLLLTAGCIALGILSARVSRQKAAVQAILQAGGRVTYQHKFSLPSQDYERTESVWPLWCRRFLGDDWFYDVEGITLYGVGCTDEMLTHVAALPRVKRLALWPCARTPANGPTGGKVVQGPLAGVTDEGLRSLIGHPSIEMISFEGNRVTDAGLRHLVSMPCLQEIQPDQLMTHQGYNNLMAAIDRRKMGR
jgi:hypothetical protein